MKANTKLKKIALLDSGVGGFSILAPLMDALKEEVMLYYVADDAFLPYGNKSDAELLSRIRVLSQKLIEEQEIDLLCLACNTATAVAIADLREKSQIPIVGVEPYLNFLNQAPLLESNASIVVITTIRTGSSQKFQLLKEAKDPKRKIVHLCLKNLASGIEKLFYEGTCPKLKEQITQELDLLKIYNPTHLILGCTHYELIKDFIENYLKLKCIGPSFAVVRRILGLLGYDFSRPSEEGAHIKESFVETSPSFSFYSTSKASWEEKERSFLDFSHMKLLMK